MIDARRARPLAVMAAERNPAFPEVPTLKEALGIDYAAGLWRGIAGPPGLSAEVRQTLGAALDRARIASKPHELLDPRAGRSSSCGLGVRC